MLRAAALAMVIVMVDGDSSIIPRQLECLSTKAPGSDITIQLRGDPGWIFSDGFESGGVARWEKPPGCVR